MRSRASTWPSRSARSSTSEFWRPSRSPQQIERREGHDLHADGEGILVDVETGTVPDLGDPLGRVRGAEQHQTTRRCGHEEPEVVRELVAPVLADVLTADYRAGRPLDDAGHPIVVRSEEHTSELQSLRHLVC